MRHNLSIRKLSDMLYIDDHTWARYESGKSTPDLAEYLQIIETLCENPVCEILKILNPDAHINESRYREAVCHYFSTVASDRDIIEAYHIIHGDHGSNPSAQLAMFAMLDNLPMRYRVAVAELIDTFWRISESVSELPDSKDIPDTALFRECLLKGLEAAKSNRTHYAHHP